LQSFRGVTKLWGINAPTNSRAPDEPSKDELMRPLRTIAAVPLLLLLAPAVALAQPRLMAGAGLSTPFGDFDNVAGPGWHANAGIQLEVPSIPIALRADGGYHSFGEESPAPKLTMLTGALSAVAVLPGVGLGPYLLGGIGVYRSSVEGSDPVSDPGFQAAFGVDIGSGTGFQGFVEVRFANVNADGGDARFVTATVGFSL
jgi:hypothetical protein